MQNNELAQIVPPLLNWYDRNARILPWRENPVPYHVWISEIMLQQTRVTAVKPYFERFITALPDMNSLAYAPEEQLLKLWEGLGYYNRVRNLQKTAQTVVKDFGGVLPADYNSLTSLPGIGSYTAGAVASIAYNVKLPAVDGNVLRVFSRLLASREDITQAAVKKAMERRITDILPDRVGDFNQALMELGAMICLPNGVPKCEECPLASLCEARRQGIALELPSKAPKKPRRIEDRTVFVLINKEKVALCKRPAKGLLSGMWELPNVQLEDTERALELWGIQAENRCQLGDAKHVFSHIEWHMTGIAVYTSSRGDFIWADERELRDIYALPTAFQYYYKKIPSLLK